MEHIFMMCSHLLKHMPTTKTGHTACYLPVTFTADSF